MVLGLAMLVLIVGLLIYILSSKAEVKEIGRIMFAFALLALLLMGPTIVALVSR